MSGRASTPRPPIYRRLSVVNSPNSPISGRNPGGELTDPIKRRYPAVFRRQPRSRVQDAHGFFFLGEVFVFLLWLWVWLVFLSVLSCFVLVDCFWLRIDSFSVCVLFWLCFSFLCSDSFVLPALSICISVSTPAEPPTRRPDRPRPSYAPRRTSRTPHRCRRAFRTTAGRPPSSASSTSICKSA